MIRADKGKIILGGSLKELITETAFVLHAITEEHSVKDKAEVLAIVMTMVVELDGMDIKPERTTEVDTSKLNELLKKIKEDKENE